MILLQTFGVSQFLGQIWGFLSNFGIFHYGWDLLVHLNMVDWKTHFSVPQGFLCFNIICKILLVLVKTFDVFQFSGQICGFLSNVGMFR